MIYSLLGKRKQRRGDKSQPWRLSYKFMISAVKTRRYGRLLRQLSQIAVPNLETSDIINMDSDDDIP